MDSIRYQYHDAELLDISLGPRRETTLTFDLYPVYYPDQPRVAVRFEGVFNLESVIKFLETVRNDFHQPDVYMARCGTLHLDDKTPSKENDVYVFLELSPHGHIRIHCQHAEETLLQRGEERPTPPDP